ncbi:MAG: hypothetical protein LUC43_06660 [Burkholderiales bacterium]|nr:hypothetical protein [Burkholderiales bacterium]
MAQEERISEECFLPSCPGHKVPTLRDGAARKVKLTPKQCKAEQVCQTILTSIREMPISRFNCKTEVVQEIKAQITTLEEQLKTLKAKTKVDILNADGRPTIAQLLDIELENKLLQCEAAGFYPRWETKCLTANCESYLTYIDGLPVDKVTCKANDGGVQGLILNSEKFIVGQKLEEYLQKCRVANLLPVKIAKKKEIYDFELAKQRAEYVQKLKDLVEPVSAGFGKAKVTIPGETFSQLMTRVDTLEVNPEQCNDKYTKALRKYVNHYNKLFKKYSEFATAEHYQVERALAKIDFHAEECKSMGEK